MRWLCEIFEMTVWLLWDKFIMTGLLKTKQVLVSSEAAMDSAVWHCTGSQIALLKCYALYAILYKLCSICYALSAMLYTLCFIHYAFSDFLMPFNSIQHFQIKIWK